MTDKIPENWPALSRILDSRDQAHAAECAQLRGRIMELEGALEWYANIDNLPAGHEYYLKRIADEALKHT